MNGDDLGDVQLLPVEPYRTLPPPPSLSLLLTHCTAALHRSNRFSVATPPRIGSLLAMVPVLQLWQTLSKSFVLLRTSGDQGGHRFRERENSIKTPNFPSLQKTLVSALPLVANCRLLLIVLEQQHGHKSQAHTIERKHDDLEQQCPRGATLAFLPQHFPP
uniref:(northern house mosquito) hypothetical protein n=1 Tax=Culex pipiens TaxID=7175 RepID=A0A8D8MK35_CULPI